MNTYTALTDAVSGSLALSALVGAPPLITFFAMLLLVKAAAHVAGLTSLAVALGVALFAFRRSSPPSVPAARWRLSPVSAPR